MVKVEWKFKIDSLNLYKQFYSTYIQLLLLQSLDSNHLLEDIELENIITK